MITRKQYVDNQSHLKTYLINALQRVDNMDLEAMLAGTGDRGSSEYKSVLASIHNELSLALYPLKVMEDYHYKID